jgi:phosphoribosylaminoimidazolecarboxamide formyltransferase/IMP cyclohydrolase
MNASPSAPLRKRALISVHDKTGLADFAAGLVELGFEIVSTGGTRRFLEENKISVIDVSSYTGFPEIMDGRVKTLHPKILGAILGRPTNAGDAAAIREHGIIPFQVVICNLYPFEKTVAKPGVSFDEAIEQIDVGGPSMVRAAAKNHAHVAVVTDPRQYPRVLESFRRGELSSELRRELAWTAFERTAAYDRAIANWMSEQVTGGQATGGEAESKFPERLTMELVRNAVLRYGENPHQTAAFYRAPNAAPSTLARAEILHGKELSYNNLLDLDAALALVREFSQPAIAIIKHNNPCGCGVAETLAEAFGKAYEGDPVSAFGSIVAVNRRLDLATADQMCQPDRFIEAIVAPDYEPDTYRQLTSKPKWAKSVRLLKCANLSDARAKALEFRSISGGALVQDGDQAEHGGDAEWNVATERAPSAEQLADLKFAWAVAKHVKSNAIVLARAGMVVGVGAGQMSRVDSVRLALEKARDRSQGTVMASDAFFPFRDGIDVAAQSGIAAVIQPGGSRNDAEVIAACNEHGMSMLFTGRRHFRH